MPTICHGGLYDGRPADALEDNASCRENEGLPVQSGTSIHCSLPPQGGAAAHASSVPLVLVGVALARRLLKTRSLRQRLLRRIVGGAAIVLAAGSAGAQVLSGPITVIPMRHPEVDQYFIDLQREHQVAQTAIEAKALALGSLGAALSGVRRVDDGAYSKSFENADIFYSKATGAHEIHGSIRDKFIMADPPLGLPTTDELPTRDGIGRFNHFTEGSVYWSPTTGPKIVRGVIRDYWASQGWEAGHLGYPVQDEHQHGKATPSEPDVWYSIFQNGAIAARIDRATGAVEVGESSVAHGTALHIDAEQVKGLLWQRFDEKIHESPDNIGLHPGVDILGVSDWGEAFGHSVRRRVTFRLYGFRDNGLAPDVDFELDVRLRFELTWVHVLQSFIQEPTSKTLAVDLEDVRVNASGLFFPGTVADGVRNGVIGAFREAQGIVTIPVSDQRSVDLGFAPDFLDYSVTPDGGIDIFLNPVPGAFARVFRIPAAQAVVDDLLDG